ncbi:phage head morphogenesis protein [Clostridium botulinum]|uniref:minor capsid protein n=1 Tax=Clostridium botulinum TaxID=1491 RepID=UPI001788C951|nr:minor capsid protein [Clostridium botulinum]MBE1305645.1 phage head morphogenesis protein [Clostridium botulinum]
MKNSEYWEKRIANNTWKTYNSLEEKNRALLEMYQEASLNISDELYRLSEKIKTSTPMLSDMHKFNRLTKLQGNMNIIIKGLGENVENFGKKNMYEGFSINYKNIMETLGQTNFSMPNKKLMEQLLNKPWFGSNFSTRLWKNTQVLATNLNDILTNGLIQGKTVTEMAIQLNNRMNEGFNVAHRLVRTETMHYLNESSIQAYKDSGCGRVQYWAASDERTCPRCGIKHGNPYIIKDAPVLPLHANCRCTYLPVIDEDDALKDHDKAKEDINNEFNKREKAGYKYNKDGTIIVTEDHKGEHYSSPRKSKPYAVIESSKVSKNGFVQIDRTLYNREGMMVKQIHSGHHNRPKQHPYGKYGEHAHIYKWNLKGEIDYRDVKELTKKERKEHKDILRE